MFNEQLLLNYSIKYMHNLFFFISCVNVKNANVSNHILHAYVFYEISIPISKLLFTVYKPAYA